MDPYSPNPRTGTADCGFSRALLGGGGRRRHGAKGPGKGSSAGTSPSTICGPVRGPVASAVAESSARNLAEARREAPDSNVPPQVATSGALQRLFSDEFCKYHQYNERRRRRSRRMRALGTRCLARRTAAGGWAAGRAASWDAALGRRPFPDAARAPRGGAHRGAALQGSLAQCHAPGLGLATRHQLQVPLRCFIF